MVARWKKTSCVDWIQLLQGKWNVTPDCWAIGHSHQSGSLTVVPVSGWGGLVCPGQILSANTSALNVASRPKTLYNFSLFFHPPLQPLQHFQRGNVQMGWLRGAQFKIVCWNKKAVVRLKSQRSAAVLYKLSHWVWNLRWVHLWRWMGRKGRLCSACVVVQRPFKE